MENSILTASKVNEQKNQVVNSKNPNVDDLFLGFISSGTKVKKQSDKWYNMLSITTDLHMMISEIMKPQGYRNDFKINLGLGTAIDGIDEMYKTYKGLKLVQEFNGEDIPFSFGYVGLDMDNDFENLPSINKDFMFGISKAMKSIIVEVLKPSEERNMKEISKTIYIALIISDAFHKDEKNGLLFHALNPMN